MKRSEETSGESSVQVSLNQGVSGTTKDPHPLSEGVGTESPVVYSTLFLFTHLFCDPCRLVSLLCAKLVLAPFIDFRKSFEVPYTKIIGPTNVLDFENPNATTENLKKKLLGLTKTPYLF